MEQEVKEQEVEKKEVEPEVKEKTEEFVPSSTEEIFTTETPSPEKEKEGEDNPEKSPPEKEAKTSQKEKKEPEKKDPDKKVETEAEVKPGKEAKTEGEDKPSIDWESDENTYKKRYSNTATYATTVNQTNVELNKKLDVINKKLDGTYVEGEDTPSPEEVQAGADYKAKLTASTKLAYKEFGQEEVEKMLYRPDSPFQVLNRDPAIFFRVKNAEMPALEAIQVVKEAGFFKKYGRDMDKIPDKIKAEMEPALRQQIKKEFQEKLKQKKDLTGGLGDLKNEGQPSPEKEGAFKPATTTQMFD